MWKHHPQICCYVLEMDQFCFSSKKLQEVDVRAGWVSCINLWLMFQAGSQLQSLLYYPFPLKLLPLLCKPDKM